MKFRLHVWLLTGLVAVISMGCEPRPVVVDPDDGDATVLEEEETNIDAVPNGTTTQPGTGVDVEVGRDTGVDVNVNPATPPGSNTSGSTTDGSQNANPNTPQ
jgi:hypothetical protein